MQKSLEEDETSFVALQNVVEQACNYFFRHDRFPTTYEELQPVPLLKVGMLTYAGDDGGTKGQAYRLALDVEGRCGAVPIPLSGRSGSLGTGAKGWTRAFLCLRKSRVSGSPTGR